MQAVSLVTSNACPIDANDVDTDQIIPKQYLKRIERSGYGPFAFSEWRYNEDGTPIADFAMNKPEHDGAEILVTGRNFGCGSSREHAAWALEDSGFKVVIASSFADIFRTNCGKVGVVCVEVSDDVLRTMHAAIAADPSVQITVDLPSQRVSMPEVAGHGPIDERFDIDEHTKHCLVNGLDDIALTLAHETDITAYEQTRAEWRPLVPTG
ncbi:MAG: 3-isopropylmalate dehydratase small subunit [Nitriliruptoraceae bacterium]